MCFKIKNEEVKEILSDITKEEIKEMDISEKMFYITTLIEVLKDTKNTHSNFNYSSLGAIKKGLNPLALKLRVRFKISDFTSKINEKGVKVWNGTLQAINVDDKNDVDSLTLELPQKTLTSGGMGETESTGATFTYLTRYLYRTLLNIADGDDDVDNYVGAGTNESKKENKGDTKKDFQKEVEKECKDVQDYVFDELFDKYNKQITAKTCIYLQWKDFNIAKERLEKIKKAPNKKITETDNGQKKITAQQKIRIQNLINFTKSDKEKMLKTYNVESLDDLGEKSASGILLILSEKEQKIKNNNAA